MWGRGGNEFVAGQCEEDTASEIRRGREGDFVDMLEGYMYTSRKSRQTLLFSLFFLQLVTEFWVLRFSFFLCPTKVGKGV